MPLVDVAHSVLATQKNLTKKYITFICALRYSKQSASIYMDKSEYENENKKKIFH